MITVIITLSCDYYAHGFSCGNVEEGFSSREQAEEYAKYNGWVRAPDPADHWHLCPDHASKLNEFMGKVDQDAKGPF
jgi:hypothetical protein